MTRRYVLAPEAALDLVQIWRYIKKQSSVEIADRVESVAMLWHSGELLRGRAFTGSDEWRRLGEPGAWNRSGERLRRRRGGRAGPGWDGRVPWPFRSIPE